MKEGFLHGNSYWNTHYLQLLTNITYNTKYYFILITTYSLYTTCNINAVTYTSYIIIVIRFKGLIKTHLFK